MSDHAKFWNKLARRYSRQKIGNPDAYAEKLKRTQALFTPDTRVFEFGCGTGGTARIHACHVAHVHAVDFSDEMIRIARDRQAEEGVENVAFEVAGIDGVGTGTQYDVVMAMSVLHLLPNWRDVIAKAHALTKTGGYFVTSTVAMEKGPWYLRAALAVLRPFGLLPPMQFIGQATLRAQFEAAGFEVTDEWRPDGADSVFMVGKRV